MPILMQFLGFGAKKPGGWSNSQGKNRRADPLCLLELSSGKVSSKLERWHVSPLPGPLANSVLTPRFTGQENSQP